MASEVAPWGKPTDNPLYAAGREVLSQTATAHAKKLSPPVGVPEVGSMPGLEAISTDGSTKAASEITVKIRVFSMQTPTDVAAYEEIASKAMSDRQLLLEFQVDGKMPPEREYYSVIEESSTWTKGADYFVALKYCIIKVTHRMVNKTDA
jgi:hypothetical protein